MSYIPYISYHALELASSETLEFSSKQRMNSMHFSTPKTVPLFFSCHLEVVQLIGADSQASELVQEGVCQVALQVSPPICAGQQLRHVQHVVVVAASAAREQHTQLLDLDGKKIIVMKAGKNKTLNVSDIDIVNPD